jgi:hypothetical protein
MSELLELMHQARQVAETAKDAMEMATSLVADKTTEKLAHVILKEAKTLLPGNGLVQSLTLSETDLPWVSVRSAMQAVHEALSQEYHGRNQANARTSRGPNSPWG